MSGEIQTQQQKFENVRQWLDKSKKQIEMALPRCGLTADRLSRIVFTSITRNPRLAECTIPTLIGAVMQSAQLGLSPDGMLGHAYLIPFKNNKKGVYEVQFMPGYKGLIDLARRSGQLSTIYARAVRANDKFSYALGTDEHITHTPATGDPGELTHVYAVAKLKDGGIQMEVMSKAEIEAIRKRSRSANDGPWITDYEAMAKKTVLKRICKMLPSSTERELEKAVALDDLVEADLPQDFGEVIDMPPEETTTPKDPLDMLAGKLEITQKGEK